MSAVEGDHSFPFFSAHYNVFRSTLVSPVSVALALFLVILSPTSRCHTLFAYLIKGELSSCLYVLRLETSEMLQSSLFLQASAGASQRSGSGFIVKNSYINGDVFVSTRLKKTGMYRQFSVPIPNMKFHEIPSGGRRIVLWGQTDRWTNMTRLVVAFRNFFNYGPKWFASFRYWNVEIYRLYECHYWCA